MQFKAKVGRAVACVAILSFASVVQSQDAVVADATSNLAARQAGVADRFSRLEELLLRLADVEARENPERASLLRRVAKQSREKFVLENLRGATSGIADGKLANAVTQQKTATEELQGLLKLLMSEDRSSRIRDEKKRITELIKQLRISERGQRSVRARTENGVELKEVEGEQETLTQKTEELQKELGEEDSETTDGDDAKEETKDEKPLNESGDSKDSPESKKSEAKPSADSKPPAEATPPEEGQPSEDQPSESKPSESKPSESKPSDAAPSQPPTPQEQAEQQVEKAVEKMRQAQEKLAQKKRDGATEQQRGAEEELRKAIDQLEKILRQLREEEIQRELAKLEARLRKMAAMQSAVLDATVKLARTPVSQRNRTTDLKAGELSFEEQEITLEADRAMLLLREEGSSVAFPEVVLQCREDTRRVATRLGQTKIDAVTQGIQKDILAGLEEMIAALQQAQRDLEKKQQEQEKGGQQQQGSGEEPLVEAIAELKLIRTMQTRIQSSTDRYAGVLDAEESSAEEVLPLLRDLSERQDRLYQITRDLVTERNR